MHNTSSVFPGNTDSRQFFSDVQLQHATIHDGYNGLVKSGNYLGASQYLYRVVEQGNVNMDYNGAYLWNRFDNIIRAIEDYVISMDSTNARPIYNGGGMYEQHTHDDLSVNTHDELSAYIHDELMGGTRVATVWIA